jgi:hypothetical protein
LDFCTHSTWHRNCENFHCGAVIHERRRRRTTAEASSAEEPDSWPLCSQHDCGLEDGSPGLGSEEKIFWRPCAQILAVASD